MRIGALRHGAEFFHDMRRGGAIRVAHTEINNVLAAASRSHFQFGSNIKYIGGKTIDTREAAFRTGVSHRFLEVTLAPGPSERRRCICSLFRT